MFALRVYMAKTWGKTSLGQLPLIPLSYMSSLHLLRSYNISWEQFVLDLKT